MNILEFIDATSKGMTVSQVTLNMIVTLVVAMFIYLIYKVTYDGVMYSKSFNVTLVLVSVVTAMVMMVIESNLALSLGMVGALSIIRFRTSVKDPRDIGFLFWGIAVGLAAGTGSYMIAAIGSVVIAAILVILSYSKLDETSYLLIVKGDNVDEDNLEVILKKDVKKYKLKMRNTTPVSNEIIYEIKLEKGKSSALVRNVAQLGSELSINIVSHDGEIIG